MNIVMAYFHCRTRIQIRTRTRIPISMATYYYAEYVSTVRAQIQIPFSNGHCTHFRDRSPSLLHAFQSGDQSSNQWKNPA